MRNKILTVTWAAAALILAGCQIWNPGGVPFTAKNGAFTLRVPARWMFATAFGKDFTASKDGVILQQIVVEHVALKEALPHSKRELSPTLAPFELAEAVIDDLHSDHTLLSFTVKENTPATLGGKPAFHIVYSLRRTRPIVRLHPTGRPALAVTPLQPHLH